MKNRYCLPLLGLVLFLTSCASTQTKIVDVRRGMETKEVLDVMGTPHDKTFRGTQELWSYDSGDGGKRKVVVFEGGKVVDLLNTDGAKPMHALADKDVNTAENRNYACTGKNQWGKFSEGGGCSMYGCWPAGGFCNGFGCSSSGICTAGGCPAKIASFRCQD